MNKLTAEGLTYTIGSLKNQKANAATDLGAETYTGAAITKDIKEMKVKVQAQLQDDQIRVSGKKLDDFQAVIAALKGKDYGIELQFSNFRS